MPVAGALPATRTEIRAAALGDKEAAQRLATLYANGEGGLTRDRNRYVGWLQWAEELGYTPPPSLDHVRK